MYSSSLCGLCSKVIGDLVRSNRVDELDVSLTECLWWYDQYEMSVVGEPSDAEVQTWFKPNEQ